MRVMAFMWKSEDNCGSQFTLSLCGSQELSIGCLAWWYMPLSTEPSCWLFVFIFVVGWVFVIFIVFFLFFFEVGSYIALLTM